MLPPELIKVRFICSRSEPTLFSQHRSYPNAFSGDVEPLGAFAYFFNTYFHPHKPVEFSHLAIAPAAPSFFDAMLNNVCVAGNGVLVPSPY